MLLRSRKALMAAQRKRSPAAKAKISWKPVPPVANMRMLQARASARKTTHGFGCIAPEV